MKYASYASVTLTDEVLTDSGDHTTFNISSASYATKRYWDKLTAFVVQTSTDGGSTWSAAGAGYTIRYLTGQVTLASALTGTPGCRIHAGAYLPINTASNANMWEIAGTAGKLESTVFGGTTPVWKTYLPGLLEATIKIGQFWADGTWITILTQAGGSLVVLALYTGRSTYERYEVFARVAQDDIKTPVSALITEPVDFISDGHFYYMAGQYG